MRSFGVGKDANGVPRLLLNGEPYFQNGLLDQGYWSDGLYTAPSDEAMAYDIRTAKELGFNMPAQSPDAKYRQMIEDPIPRLICTLAIPTIISMLITSVYNMADTFFVGKIGTSATGAVGVVFSLMAIFQAVGFTFGIGSGNFVSRLLGGRDKEQAEHVAATGFYTAFAVGILLTVLGFIFLDPLMRVLGATDTILPYARDYARYILLGAPFITSSFVLNNLLRFQGSAMFNDLLMSDFSDNQQQRGCGHTQ